MSTPIPPSPIADPKGNVTMPWYLFLQGQSMSFTPGFTFGGVSSGVSYASQQGQANAVFGRVFFDLVVSLSAKGTGVGTAVLTGLPQVVKSVSNYKPSFSVGFVSALSTTVSTQVMASGSQGESNIYLFKVSAGASALLTNVDFNSASEVRISGSYQV